MPRTIKPKDNPHSGGDEPIIDPIKGNPVSLIGIKEAFKEAARLIDADPELEQVAVYAGCLKTLHREGLYVAVQIRSRK